jgi:endonuclease/exonuclease/phosphatase family metal-dependent hydrolase
VRDAGRRHVDALGATALSVLSYNIRHGVGMDDALDLRRTARVIESLAPDIVALQEVDQRVTRSGGVAQADSLASLLGMRSAFGAFMPYQGGEYGLAILSRHPVVRTHALRLPDGNEARVALLVDVQLPQGPVVTVVNVHFDWVDDDTYRYAQAESLARVLDTLSTPYVLLGDFNDRPGSRTLSLFTSRAQEAGKPIDAHFAFPSDTPTKEIDFIFASPRARWTTAGARVIAERVASDHRPVHAMLTLTAESAPPH